MSARLIATALLVLALIGTAGGARAETLIVSLSRDNILIQSNFTGERLSLFGVIQREGDEKGASAAYDAVVTVRGPRGAVTVRRKEQYGPMWLNLDERKYIAIPAFLAVQSNRSLTSIASASVREDLRIGINAQVPQQIVARGANDPRFREALQRLRIAQGLFRENPEAVRFIAPNVFQAFVDLPGTAPLGDYDVDVMVFANGAMIARGNTKFRVAKTAAEQTLATIAAEHGVWFGMGTSILALLVGWLASVIFRRD
ncbi:MAG: hypothetical protein BGP04_23195 [Rhizobiales bacterium 62-17]|nr:TIGR02186 family protein [Hyphomicrobiales bacterium]OJY00470.1 MAG: hypothetical protein BGP04_23195 [Rhizobiales bacterium 62-17]